MLFDNLLALCWHDKEFHRGVYLSERKFPCNMLIIGIKEIRKSKSMMLYLPFENGTVFKKKSCQVNLCEDFLIQKDFN